MNKHNTAKPDLFVNAAFPHALKGAALELLRSVAINHDSTPRPLSKAQLTEQLCHDIVSLADRCVSNGESHVCFAYVANSVRHFDAALADLLINADIGKL